MASITQLSPEDIKKKTLTVTFIVLDSGAFALKNFGSEKIVRTEYVRTYVHLFI